MINIETTKRFAENYDSVPELLKDLFEAILTKVEYVYRGISQSIELIPNINRIRLCEKSEKIHSFDKYEYRYLYDFYRLARPLLKSSNSNCLEIAALAQHYGIPTRLLDWTKDPFVALFFAISNNPEPDNGKYTILYTDLSKSTFFDHSFQQWQSGQIYDSVALTEVNDVVIEYKSLMNLISDEESLKKAILQRQDAYKKTNIYGTCQYRKEKLIFYDAPFTNERMLAQKGLFSIPRSIKGDDAKTEMRWSSSFTIEITPKERRELINFLRNMQYTRATLFPELASLAQYVRDEIMLEQNYLFNIAKTVTDGKTDYNSLLRY